MLFPFVKMAEKHLIVPVHFNYSLDETNFELKNIKMTRCLAFLHCQKLNKTISAIKLDIKCIRFCLLAFLFHNCFSIWMMLIFMEPCTVCCCV